MKNNMMNIWDNMVFFYNLAVGVALYWLAFRKKSWFILTGHEGKRWGLAGLFYLGHYHYLKAGYQFINSTVFSNSRNFEKAINKHNLDAKTKKTDLVL